MRSVGPAPPELDSTGFAAIAGTLNGGPFAVDFANGRQDGITLSSGMRPKIFGVQFADGRWDHRPAWCAQPFRARFGSSRGPAIAANPREGSRLLRFCAATHIAASVRPTHQRFEEARAHGLLP